MRKKDDSLRELLLAAARDIIAENGAEALNIRVLASRAGIATGTIYNYFENKDDILLSLADEYWKKALAELKQRLISGRFADQLDQICAFLRERIRDSHGNLMSSLGNVRVTARERMRSMQSLVRDFNVYRWAGRMLLDAARIRQRERLALRIGGAG